MRFQRRPPEEPSLNLTPLIDVVFLLLIFFMISTTFERDAGIMLELPTSRDADTPPLVTPLEILIDASGHYHVAGEALINQQQQTLQRALRQQLAARPAGTPPPPVILSADRRTPHQAVVTALDVARRLGLDRIAIATRTEEGL